MNDGSYGSGYHGSHHGAGPQGPITPATIAGQNAAATHRPKEQGFQNPSFGGYAGPPPIIPTAQPSAPYSGPPYSHYDRDSLWGRGNRLFTLVGAIAGVGYGVWSALFSGGTAGLGSAVLTTLKWAGAGLVGGALFQMGVVAALSLGLLWGILMLLGLLLNLLAGT
jgi:hypothetical protein